MHSAWIGQLMVESLGRGIDSRKEIDLWLLQNNAILQKVPKFGTSGKQEFLDHFWLTEEILKVFLSFNHTLSCFVLSTL